MTPEQKKEIKTQMTRIVRGLRGTALPADLALDRPLHYRSDRILFDGKIRRRMRIVFLSSACRVGTCTMCPFPDESLPGVSAQHLKRQFDYVFEQVPINDHEIVTLFNDGNFFDDAEISPDVRDHIYKKIQQSTVKYLIVESLPQYINKIKLHEAKLALGNSKRLSVFIGLQSSNDIIREVAVNTTCTLKSFERACEALFEYDYLPLTFLMVKPPFVLEDETIADVCNSLRYLATMGVGHTTLCPARVAPKTLLQLLYQQKQYQPPWIWTVIEILKRNADMLHTLPMVNTTELKPERNSDSICAEACPKCRESTIKALESFLYTRDFKLLHELKCDCQKSYLKFKEMENERWGTMEIYERIKEFLSQQSGNFGS